MTKITVSWCSAHGFYHAMIWNSAAVNYDRSRPDHIVLEVPGSHSYDEKHKVLQPVNDRMFERVLILIDLGLLVLEETE